MTTQNTTTETATAATEAPTTDTVAVVGAREEFARLDPNMLEVGPNVRDQVNTDAPEFRALVASIAEHGVLQAISAIRDGQRVIVVDGQQRTLASIEAGAETVPVVIRSVTGSAKAREIARLSQQIVSNDRRIDLTVGQRAKAVTDMLELGVSVTKIAKTVQMDKTVVKTAATAGRSQAALDALDAGQLDLEQAAIIATFDADGDDEAVAELLEVRRYDFKWTAQRLLTARQERKDRAAAAQPYGERGFTVLTEEPEHGDGYLRAEDFVTVAAEGEGSSNEVTTEVIDAQPQAWAVWLSQEEQITLTKTGEPVEEDSIDWDTQDDPEQAAENGLHHHKDVTTSQVWVAEYFTADPVSAGVTPGPVLAAALAEPAVDVDPSDAAALAAAREQTRLAAEAAAKEAERAARRRTKALNVASVASTVLRKEFLTRFVARKTPPKGAAKWITDMLVDEPGLLTQNKASEHLAELLGVAVEKPSGHIWGEWKERAARDALAPVIEKASEARAQVILLAQVLAAYEARMSGTGKDWWKREGYGNFDNYLGFLGQHGHTLTPVEDVAAGTLTPEAGYDALTAPSSDTSAEAVAVAEAAGQ